MRFKDLDPDEPLELGDDANQPTRLNWPFGLGGMLILALVFGAGYLLFSNRADPTALAEITATPTLTTLQTATPDPNIAPRPTQFPLNPSVPVLDDSNRAGVAEHSVAIDPLQRMSRGAASALTWLPIAGDLLVGSGMSLNWHEPSALGLYSARIFSSAPTALLPATLNTGQGVVFAGFEDGGLLMLSLSGDVLAEYDYPRENPLPIYKLALSPDGRWLAASPNAHALPPVAGPGLYTVLIDLTGELSARVFVSNAINPPNRPQQPIREIAFDAESTTLFVFELPSMRCRFDLLTASDGSYGICRVIPLWNSPMWAGAQLGQVAYHSETNWLAMADRRGRLFIMPWGQIEAQMIDFTQCVGCPSEVTFVVTSLHFSADGRYLAVGTGVGVFVVAIPSGEVQFAYTAPDFELAPLVRQTAFDSRNARLAVLSTSGIVEVIDLNRRNPPRMVSDYAGQVADIAVLYGQMAVGYESGVVQLWQVNRDRLVLNDTFRISGQITEIAHADHGEHLVILRTPSLNNSFDLPYAFNLQLTDQRVHVFTAAPSGGSSIATTEQHPWVLLSSEGFLTYYSLNEGRVEWSIAGQGHNIAYTSSGRFVMVASQPNAFDYVDTSMAMSLGQLAVPNAYAPFVVINASGAILQRPPNVVYRYDIHQRDVMAWADAPLGTAIATSEDNILAAVGGNDGSLQFYWASNLNRLTVRESQLLLAGQAIEQIVLRRVAENVYQLLVVDQYGALYRSVVSLSPTP